MEAITPEEYGKILKGIELKNILLSEIKASIKHEILSEGLKINIKDEADFEFENNEFIVFNKYVLTAKNKEKKTALKIEAKYIIVFESEREITESFFEVYKKISLPLNIWPFFRELVNTTTARMNIPPLTLPLLKRSS